MVVLGDTFRLGDTAVTYGTVLHARGVSPRRGCACGRPRPGRHVYAVGNNAEAARLMGIPTARLILGVYTFAGLMYGIAALLAVARTGVGDPQAGQTDNLDSITAVVLGGTSLFGGRGVDPRQPRRRAHRWRVPQRPHPDGRGVGLSDPDYGDPGDSRRRDRSTVATARVCDHDGRGHTHTGPAGARARQALRSRDRAGRRRPRSAGPARSWRSSATTAPASRRWSRRCPVRSFPTRARYGWTGSVVKFHSPGDARRQGIETVYQDLALAPAMTIAENLFLGRELRKAGRAGIGAAAARQEENDGRRGLAHADAADRHRVR